MKIDPLDILLKSDFELTKKFFFISGNEITLMEKISRVVFEKYRTKEKASLTKIDTIENFVEEASLFESRKIYYGKNCKGINEDNLKKVRNNHNTFLFFQENSAKTKKIKNIFLKDREAYLIDCYELNRNAKIRILNEFLNVNKLKINQDIYWFLAEKLDSKYILLENSLNKILELDEKDITIINIKKILTIDDKGKEKLFFYLFKKNKDIIEAYRNKINTPSDVNELYYYCKYFCQLIIDSKSEEDYKNKIPVYLFKEKNFLIDVFKKYSSKKKKMLLKLLYTTEKVLRKESGLSTIYGLRFLLNIKKITVS